MSRQVSSPLANCKVAFFRAALRRQTAGSACSKWCPSAQKHFRAQKNTGRAHHCTFKSPLYRRDCVLRRDHKVIRPRGMSTAAQTRLFGCSVAVENFFVPHHTHSGGGVCLQMDKTWSVWQADQQSMVTACHAPVKHAIPPFLPLLFPLSWTHLFQLLKHDSLSCFFPSLSP